jgi:hypothetical protein
VISHDCDIASAPNQEPNVEVIVGCRIDSSNGNFTHAKNARRLHLDFRQEEARVAVELLATKKISISKESLFDFQPRDGLSLDQQGHSILQRWLAARYRRAAFPDEFDRRLADSGLKDKLGKILKPLGPWIPAVFFDIDAGEEIKRAGPDDTYVLDVIILHTTEDDPDKALTAATQVKQEIEKAFREKLYVEGTGWRHIELRDCLVMSDEALTYRQSTLLKQWRLEHISLREDPVQPMFALREDPVQPMFAQ